VLRGASNVPNIGFLLHTCVLEKHGASVPSSAFVCDAIKSSSTIDGMRTTWRASNQTGDPNLTPGVIDQIVLGIEICDHDWASGSPTTH